MTDRKMTWDEVVAEMVKFRAERDRLKAELAEAVEHLLHLGSFLDESAPDLQSVLESIGATQSFAKEVAAKLGPGCKSWDATAKHRAEPCGTCGGERELRCDE